MKDNQKTTTEDTEEDPRFFQFPPWNESDFSTFREVGDNRHLHPEGTGFTIFFNHVINRGHPDLNGYILDEEGGFSDGIAVHEKNLNTRLRSIIELNGNPDETIKAIRALEKYKVLGPEQSGPNLEQG